MIEFVLTDPLVGALLRSSMTSLMVFGVFVYIMVWAERKVSAAMQNRIGPNRLGPMGILQGVADGVKFAFKENVRPSSAHPFFFYLAPFAALFPAILVYATIPFGLKMVNGHLHPIMIANLSVGVLFVLSVSSLGVFSLLLAGWASNSKFPMLGGLRAGAQVISYEIPMALCVLSVLMLSGSASLVDIVQAQSTGPWFFMLCPLGFLIFLVSIFAETNRLPFDMPEGESEIVGFHAEYSGMKFAMFFMAEYGNMFFHTQSCGLCQRYGFCLKCR